MNPFSKIFLSQFPPLLLNLSSSQGLFLPQFFCYTLMFAKFPLKSQRPCPYSLCLPSSEEKGNFVDEEVWGWEVVAVAWGTGWCGQGGPVRLRRCGVWGECGEAQLSQRISIISNLHPLSGQLASSLCRLSPLTWELKGWMNKHLRDEWTSYFLQNQNAKGANKHAKNEARGSGNQVQISLKCHIDRKVGGKGLSRKNGFYPRCFCSSFSPSHCHLKASWGVSS